MGIEININNTKINDKSVVLNKTSIRSKDDVKINVLDSEINGQSVVLENLKIDSVLEELKQKTEHINKNSKEYSDIQEILNIEQGNDKKIIERIKKHLLEFSQGVLASIVANRFT